WVEPASDETVAVTNPANENVIARVPRATVDEAERAIQAARVAFDEGPWPRMTGKERGRVMRQFADALWAHRDEIADTVVAQGGCTITQAKGMQVYLPIQMMYRF